MSSLVVKGRVLSGSPKTHALMYRIWAYAAPRGWDVTAKEIAEHLGVSSRRVTVNLINAGWSGRVRSSMVDSFEAYPNSVRAAHAVAHELGALTSVDFG